MAAALLDKASLVRYQVNPLPNWGPGKLSSRFPLRQCEMDPGLTLVLVATARGAIKGTAPTHSNPNKPSA